MVCGRFDIDSKFDTGLVEILFAGVGSASCGVIGALAAGSRSGARGASNGGRVAGLVSVLEFESDSDNL